MELQELFSYKLTKGKRTYFFDIKESLTGDLYLNVSENKKTEHGYDRYRIMIFNEDLDQFADMFQRALRKLYEIKGTRSVYNSLKNDELDQPSAKS